MVTVDREDSLMKDIEIVRMALPMQRYDVKDKSIAPKAHAALDRIERQLKDKS